MSVHLYDVKTREDFKAHADKLTTELENARTALAQKASSNTGETRAKSLLDQLYVVARLEEKKRIMDRFVYVFKHAPEMPISDVWREMALEIGLQGADDSWSGRGNDFQRVQHDARLEFLRDTRYTLENL